LRGGFGFTAEARRLLLQVIASPYLRGTALGGERAAVLDLPLLGTQAGGLGSQTLDLSALCRPPLLNVSQGSLRRCVGRHGGLDRLGGGSLRRFGGLETLSRALPLVGVEPQQRGLEPFAHLTRLPRLPRGALQAAQTRLDLGQQILQPGAVGLRLGEMALSLG